MKVVIFGLGDLANTTWFMLRHDSSHEVVGFTVDGAFLSQRMNHGLPVVAFEEVEKHFPPESVAMIAPLGGRNMNQLRVEKFHAGRAKGYQFISYVSSKAVTWPDLAIGENCILNEACIVRPFARLGNNVSLGTSAMVSHHVQIDDHCFLAAEAAIGGGATIGECCFLGMNATVRDYISVAPRCFIAAGAVVVKDTEENGIYMGVPARRRPEPASKFNPF